MSDIGPDPFKPDTASWSVTDSRAARSKRFSSRYIFKVVKAAAQAKGWADHV